MTIKPMRGQPGVFYDSETGEKITIVSFDERNWRKAQQMGRENMARVQSRSSKKSDRKYTISMVIETEEWQCSCPGWTRRMPRQDCTHIQACKIVAFSATPDKTIQWSRYGKAWLETKHGSAGKAVSVADVERRLKAVKRNDQSSKRFAFLEPYDAC